MMLNGFNLDEKQSRQFAEYYDFLVAENKKYNLTAITEEAQVYGKHFYDSLAAMFFIDFSKIEKLCDIGSGGGFPAIPLKIAFPHLRLSLIEPTKKKIGFLRELCALLKLTGVEFINERAEDHVRKRREYYGMITARAVAALPVLLELTLPLLKVGGVFIAYKGSNYEEEIKASGNALKTLSAVIEDAYEYQLPDDLGRRAIIKVKKLKKTDRAYPRHYAQIKKKSL